MTRFFVALPALAVACVVLHDPAPQAPPKMSDLHPALTVDSGTAGRLFDRGRKDGDTVRDAGFLNSTFRRGIGSVRANMVKNETVSWLHLYTIAESAYLSGFECRKKYLADDEASSRRDLYVKGGPTVDHIVFTGTLNLCPSFGIKNKLVRKANPDDLKGVRVVLKVGDRIYQPEDQPGDLAYTADVNLNVFRVPTSSSPSVIDVTTGQVVKFNAFYTTTTVQGYEQYTGQFGVSFNLFNADGSARVTAKDKEITAIVIYGANERRATYSLDALAQLTRERSAPK